MYLIPLALYFAGNVYLVRRLSDRPMLAIYAPTGILLLATHAITLTVYKDQVPKLLISLADAAALALLVSVFFRNAVLLIRSYRQRHEYILENLALGTSHRVGEDFLTGMVEAIGEALAVDLVLITESLRDDSSESVVAFSRREDLTLCRLVDVGSLIDCRQEALASLAPGKQATVIPLSASEGTSIGHLILLHDPQQ